MNCPGCVREVTAWHPTGICWRCFLEAEDDDGRDFLERPAPARSTTALPGTPRKLATLESRHAEGSALWHPDDARTPSAMLTLLGEIWVAGLLEQASFHEATPRVPQRQLVLDWLREEARPLRPREIAASLGLRRGTVHVVLAKLRQEGMVSRAGNHRYVALGVVSQLEPSPVLEGIAS